MDKKYGLFSTFFVTINIKILGHEQFFYSLIVVGGGGGKRIKKSPYFMDNCDIRMVNNFKMFTSLVVCVVFLALWEISGD